MTDGIIDLDTERGCQFGFTSDRFYEGSYLWKHGSRIIVSFIVSFIESKAPGNFRALAETILGAGLNVAVRRAGYVQSWEEDDLMGAVEVWTKGPTK